MDPATSRTTPRRSAPPGRRRPTGHPARLVDTSSGSFREMLSGAAFSFIISRGYDNLRSRSTIDTERAAARRSSRIEGMAPQDPTMPPQRRAARVVLLDPRNRVLLMRYDDGPPNGSHWATPGGGLEPGETYEQAALRELAEETGWTDIVLLGEIHRRSHTME